MLHILDGESSATTLALTEVPGERFAWREALIAGPTPTGVEGNEWLRIRASHLSEYYGLDLAKCDNDLLEQERLLATFKDHEEVVLWFEHDLFCQANLLYLLNWFSKQSLGDTKLSLVSIDKFPGIEGFRGLGQLNGEQLAALFDERKQVTEGQLRLGKAGWKAYRSPVPGELEEFLQRDLSELPFLKRALELHRMRFPSVRNGLGRVDDTGLRLIAGGVNRFRELFSRFMAAAPVYGLGDFQFWIDLKRMGTAQRPLLQIGNGVSANAPLSSNEILNSTFVITDMGRDVLNNKADFIELNGIDLWLGGVHLQTGNIWRWDDQRQSVIKD